MKPMALTTKPAAPPIRIHFPTMRMVVLTRS